VDTLKLTLNNGTHNVEIETACEYYTWHEETYTQSGIYTYAYTNTNGCASVDTLKLTILYGTHNVESITACEFYTWHEQTFTQSGTYTYNYSNENGCASTDTLHLTISPVLYAEVEETICENDLPYHYINGQIDTTFGTNTPSYSNYNFQLLTQGGCDSIVTLNLTILTYPEVYIEGDTLITQGESTTLSVEDNPHWSYLWSTGDTTSSITITPSETTPYSVTVSNGPCQGTAEITVTVTTGVHQHPLQEIVLYPNPTTGMIHIQGGDIISVQLTDIAGQLVAVYEKQNVLDLSHLAAGVYNLRIVTPDGVAVRKVVKQNW